MKRGYVDTPDGQIHYRTVGTGAPVVVLHHTPSSSEAMIPLLNGLGEEMQAIGMDTVGYGQSDRPKAGPYTTMEQFAQSVAWFIQGLGFEKVNLFGFLTGSQIAMQTAADFPDLVESVAVYDCFNWNTPSRRAVHERLHRYHKRQDDGSHLMEIWNRYQGRTDLKSRELSFKNLLTVNDDEGAEALGGMGWEGAGPYAMTHQEMWDVTPRIKAPVYVMYGAESELHRSLEKFLETLPRAKGTRESPSARTDPEGLAKELIAFYKNPGI